MLQMHLEFLILIRFFAFSLAIKLEDENENLVLIRIAVLYVTMGQPNSLKEQQGHIFDF